MALELYKETKSDRIFDTFNYLVISVIFAVILYPLILVVSSSFSSGNEIILGKVWFLPVSFNFTGYAEIFKYKSVLIGYGNSLAYLAAGTLVNLIFTIIAAYPLSRSDLKGKKVITLLFVFTMLFNAGLIPNYILVKQLNLIDSRLVMIIPKALNPWNLIVTITYIRTTIPKELIDASKIDGCNDFKFLTQILISLSKPIIAVMALFYAVEHWNSFFDAMIYLNTSSKFPLQLVLKEILLQNSLTLDMMSTMQLTAEEMAQRLGLSEQLKYALIIVASLPLMVFYPFVQKYFIQGIMVGSIKG